MLTTYGYDSCCNLEISVSKSRALILVLRIFGWQPTHLFFQWCRWVKWYSVFTFHRVWAEEVTFLHSYAPTRRTYFGTTTPVRVFTRTFHRIFFLSWKEGDDVWVGRRWGPPQPLGVVPLVRVREAIFEEFHNGTTPEAAPSSFDWCSNFTKVAERNQPHHRYRDSWRAELMERRSHSYHRLLGSKTWRNSPQRARPAFKKEG